MKHLLRNAYDLLPMKQSVFEIARRVLSPPEAIFKHLHFRGDFRVDVDDAHSFIIRHYGFELENAIFWSGLRGGWEKTSISLWVRLVRRAQVILDVGANTGIYSLIAKSLNPQAKVYALEPVRRVFEKLEYNNQLNNYDIACLQLAASDYDGVATIYDLPTEHVYSVTVNKNLQGATAEVIPTKILVTRMDTLIGELGLPRIDLMKIDVETHEAEVLEGMGCYLADFRPTLLIEILNDDVGRRVEAIVRNMGYLYFNLDERTNSARRVNTITASDYYNYLLCDIDTATALDLTTD